VHRFVLLVSSFLIPVEPDVPTRHCPPRWIPSLLPRVMQITLKLSSREVSKPQPTFLIVLLLEELTS
jgi:hypothetical protein